ncbi:MAG: hypothetical protein ACLQUW_10475, partial [Desulfobaccales bacterium]
MYIPPMEGNCYGPKLITALKTSHIRMISLLLASRFLGALARPLIPRISPHPVNHGKSVTGKGEEGGGFDVALTPC